MINIRKKVIKTTTREMQIKITRYHFIFFRMAIIKKTKQRITSVGKDVENLEP